MKEKLLKYLEENDLPSSDEENDIRDIKIKEKS